MSREQEYAWASSPKNSGKVYKFNWKNLNQEFEEGNYAGAYGWDNAVWYGIAEKKANTDLNEFHSKRTEDEYFIPCIKKLIDNPKTQKHWGRIVTFNPLGMTSTPPTIAATNSYLMIPEIKRKLLRDGEIVRKKDGAIKTVKMAIQYV